VAHRDRLAHLSDRIVQVLEAALLALSASLFTATSSICQRLGAKETEHGTGFSVEILLRLIRRPIWLLGIASMIAGFVLQIIALHYGGLAIVQPVLACELVLVFAYLRIVGKRAVRRRDWFAAVSMVTGLGLFIYSASPTNGRDSASALSWWLAGSCVAGVVAIAIAVAYVRSGQRHTSSSRRAAALGVATGVTWGFLASVIREFGSRLDHGLAATFTNWSPYVLIAVGIIAMVLESNAVSAGSLAASQPGFTMADPIVATILGIVFFDERIRVAPFNLSMEVIAALLAAIGAIVLSHSPIVATTEDVDHATQ
jgi:drug/metabolite transporter (DMT)-like permease